MDPSKDLSGFVTDELLQLRQKAQLRIGDQDVGDAQDEYVSALIGHLFASLLAGFGPNVAGIDRSPEGLAAALTTIGKKVSVVAESLDPRANYRIQILRREKEQV